MGDKGGKSDMERVGLFKEMKYITVGDPFKTPGQGVFNESASKGKQMLPGGLKEKSAKQDGYFNDKFGRVFEGESYTDPVKLRRLHRMSESKKNLSKAFLPTNGYKTMNGLGTFYGTLGGTVSSFSPASKESGSKREPLKNILTNPGKKGTGYGYVNICLNPYPPHGADDYNKGIMMYKQDLAKHKAALKAGAFRLNMHPADYFSPNPYRSDVGVPAPRKWAGDLPEKPITTPFRPSNPGKNLAGMKAGTFDPYPSHSADPYGIKYKRPVNVVNKIGKQFVPPPGPKSTPCNSIVNQNVTRSVNITNYRTITVV
ncbi:UPF0602 protein C4orf47 homolog isoform X2 [Physella acuta]|uniref:UPF0602 protein C4orf47 homolog isoform X2 n=1 Tax=Physella acuta TaxID=109671 RepID=UPI0027DCDD19|nr:UPF0602 protein C4orf47 homolog isoform X2 [Physella acuta]XP_059156792.1 UPF0602 protein C4orf47 homolog isoform X2 [Physella acuta]